MSGHLRLHSDSITRDDPYPELDDEGEVEVVMPPDWDLRPSWTIPVRSPVSPHRELFGSVQSSTLAQTLVSRKTRKRFDRTRKLSLSKQAKLSCKDVFPVQTDSEGGLDIPFPNLGLVSEHIPHTDCVDPLTSRLSALEVSPSSTITSSTVVSSRKGDIRIEVDIEELLMLPNSDWNKARINILSNRDLSAESMLDVLQLWLDRNPQHERRRAILRLLIDLASSSEMFPSTLFRTGISLEFVHPISGGGFADVYRGSFNGQTIALKRLRVNEQGRERRNIHRKFCKESLTWRQLSHPNILPFLGIDAETFKDINALALISPWMNSGTIMDYVRASNYDAGVHRLRLMIAVAEGLKYLHGQGLAHGDLHGSNIFMTEDEQPCLADFGLTVISDMTISHDTTTTMNFAGAARWLAPELLSHDKAVNRRTRAGDVFAFGRLCLAICTTRRPFYEIQDISVLLLISNGKHPPRPTHDECPGLPLPDNLWSLINQCWEIVPAARPNMLTVLDILQMKTSIRETNERRDLMKKKGHDRTCICM